MGKLIEDGIRRCLCGHWIKVNGDAGTCAHCGRTLAEVREHHRKENHARASDRETLRAINARRCERRKEISRMVAECRRIDQERGRGKSAAPQTPRVTSTGEGPNKPLGKMRRCHDCGTMTWNYRCAKCRAIWRAKHGAGGLYDPAAGFRGGEVEHEVAI